MRYRSWRAFQETKDLFSGAVQVTHENLVYQDVIFFRSNCVALAYLWTQALNSASLTTSTRLLGLEPTEIDAIYRRFTMGDNILF